MIYISIKILIYKNLTTAKLSSEAINSTNINDNNEENNIRAIQKTDHRAPQVVIEKNMYTDDAPIMLIHLLLATLHSR